MQSVFIYVGVCRQGERALTISRFFWGDSVLQGLWSALGPRADERCYLNVSATPFLHFPSCPTAPIFFPACQTPPPPPSSPFPSTHTRIPDHLNSPITKLPHIPPWAHTTVHHTHFFLYLSFSSSSFCVFFKVLLVSGASSVHTLPTTVLCFFLCASRPPSLPSSLLPFLLHYPGALSASTPPIVQRPWSATSRRTVRWSTAAASARDCGPTRPHWRPTCAGTAWATTTSVSSVATCPRRPISWSSMCACTRASGPSTATAALIAVSARTTSTCTRSWSMRRARLLAAKSALSPPHTPLSSAATSRNTRVEERADRTEA